MITWDPDKAASNLLKHGIHFADAATVLEDDLALTIEDPDEFEPRFVTVGCDASGQILVVVYAYEEYEDDYDDEEVIRIISARRANRRERQSYEG